MKKILLLILVLLAITGVSMAAQPRRPVHHPMHRRVVHHYHHHHPIHHRPVHHPIHH